MPSSNLCWGIEIGAGAVKALKLERDGDQTRLVDFIVIPHKKVLSTPDLDQADAIRVALGQLVSQRDLSGAVIAVSIPGHQSFARFAKLPPVDPKKAPDLIKFEAAQQIPFPIEQVEWDYQTFISQDSPEIEVGIFAVTRDKISERLALLNDAGISPDVVTVGPVAVYNAIAYDLNFTDKTTGAILLDIGAVSSDLIIADAGRVWIRTFPLGGHAFTDAVARAFKLDYGKAEKLKRDFESSQHRKQVFQAMKPAFEDLLQDIQRSIQYYKQLHPEANLTRVLGIGATFQLPGLRKFLSQRLGMDVVRLDQFHKIGVEGPMGAEFASAAMQLTTAYGLSLQGLGQSPIRANLIPTTVVREKVWKSKTPWFAAAAGLSLVAGAATFVRPILDRGAIVQPSQQAKTAVNNAKREGQALKTAWEEVGRSQRIGATVVNYQRLLEGREFLPQLVRDVGDMLASAQPQPGILQGNATSIPPAQWRAFELRSLQVDSVSSVAGPPTTLATTTSPQIGRGAPERGRGAPPAPRGGPPIAGTPGNALPTIDVTLVVDTTNAEGIPFVTRTIGQWLLDNVERPGVPYRITGFNPSEIVGAPVATSAQQAAANRAQTDPAARGGAPGGPSPLLTPNAPLAEVAALPGSASSFPAGAPVNRYTIRFQLIPFPPGEEPRDDSRAAPSASARHLEGTAIADARTEGR